MIDSPIPTTYKVTNVCPGIPGRNYMLEYVREQLLLAT
jgi:hypothetical protein